MFGFFRWYLGGVWWFLNVSYYYAERQLRVVGGGSAFALCIIFSSSVTYSTLGPKRIEARLARPSLGGTIG